MTGLVTLGETMGIVRTATGLEQAHDARIGIGGAESNVAIGFARLGGEATWIGRVGNDGLGRRVLREIRAEGVHTLAAIDESAPTGLLIKETPVPDRTRVTYYRAGNAGSRLNVADVYPAVIQAAGILHVTGITPGLSTTASEAVDAALAAAKGTVPVSFDVNHRDGVWQGRDPKAAYIRLAERAAVVFAGDREAALLVGEAEPAELARRIAKLGAHQVVIKLGDRGSVALIDGKLHTVPAIRVRAVDTVGAGDAFVAGYLHALLAGRPAAERLDLATRCGAFACLGAGDWESSPRTADLALLDGAEDAVAR